MEVTFCPSPLMWHRYALGLVEEADQQALEAHLGTCPACLELVGRVPEEDTLVDDLRHGLSAVDEPRDPAVEQVIRSAAGLVASETPPPSDDRLQRAADVIGSLATPQGAGEVRQLAQFRVLRLLGQGGMGVVYLAEDAHLRRRVALKVLRPDFAGRPDAAERFLREARAAATLRHDHVVTIYQVGEADTPAGRVPFLAMEFLEGESLGAALAQRPPTLAEAVRIGREVAEGLAAAHASGLVHRDVKPDNIFLERRNGNLEQRPDSSTLLLSPSPLRVKLLDFGLVRAAQRGTQLTESGVVVGTPAYMAPEQAAGREVDGRADLFSLGCVLYRLCTGRVPFPGSDVMAVLSALATQQPVPVRQVNPAVPPALADLIHRLLAKDPARRPASAREVAGRLDGIERQLAASASSPSRSRRSWLPVTVLAAALVTLAALVVAAVVIVRLPNGSAEFVIDTDDPDILFRADGKGGVVLEDRKADRRYQLKVGRQDPATGEYEIDVTEPVAGLQFSTRTLTIKRGERVALKAALRAPEEPPLPAGVTGIDRDWLRTVARLPAAEQVALVTVRLKELNPDFEGPVTPTVEKGVVIGLEFSTSQVANLVPVRGLPGLTELRCHVKSGEEGRGRLTDLSPLAGLPLRVLSLTGNSELSDFRPLAGMPLVDLECYGTAVADLTPLQKCPLQRLNVGGTRIRSLEAVKGLPLRVLEFNDVEIDDLSPVAGLPLEELSCGNTQVQDLSPLRKMRLTSLHLSICNRVKDLSPLEGMPLEDLDITGTSATDMPLRKDVPLRHLFANEDWVVAHRQRLQALPKLETINYKPVKEFWAELDAKKPD